jgi:hypothetical protein
LTLNSGVLPWSTMAHGVGSHCGRVGLARATCAEEVQKTHPLGHVSRARRANSRKSQGLRLLLRLRVSRQVCPNRLASLSGRGIQSRWFGQFFAGGHR